MKRDHGHRKMTRRTRRRANYQQHRAVLAWDSELLPDDIPGTQHVLFRKGGNYETILAVTRPTRGAPIILAGRGPAEIVSVRLSAPHVRHVQAATRAIGFLPQEDRAEITRISDIIGRETAEFWQIAVHAKWGDPLPSRVFLEVAYRRLPPDASHARGVLWGLLAVASVLPGALAAAGGVPSAIDRDMAPPRPAVAGSHDS